MSSESSDVVKMEEGIVTSIPWRHNEYYLSDGDVILLAEDTLFKVHRSKLEEYSCVFRDMWTMPGNSESNNVPEGTNDNCPIAIYVKAIDFTRLLWIIYYDWRDERTKLKTPKTVDEWLSILDITDRWQISNLRWLATKELNDLPMNPVHKIAKWQKYNLDRNQLFESFVELSTRSRSITFVEAQAIGLTTLTLIAEARDEVHRKGLGKCCSGNTETGSTIKHGDGMSAKLKFNKKTVLYGAQDKIVDDIVRRIFGVRRGYIDPSFLPGYGGA